MLGGGQPRHLDANFRDAILRRPLTDPRDGVQERDDLRERATQRLDLDFTLGDTLFEELNVRQDVREQLGMVGPETPEESGLEVLLLFPEAAFRDHGRHFGGDQQWLAYGHYGPPQSSGSSVLGA
jgi:hypothetical protein